MSQPDPETPENPYLAPPPTQDAGPGPFTQPLHPFPSAPPQGAPPARMQPYAAQFPPGQAPYGQAPYGQAPHPYGTSGVPWGPPPDHPQATTALILGIVGAMGFVVTGPFAWYLGAKARREIDADPARWGARGQATAGLVLGILSTIGLALFVGLIALIAIGIASASVAERTVPPRPHHSLTEDGRPLREVLSYSRRGSRFTPRQAAGWEAHAEDWFVPEEAVDAPDFSWPALFGREAPLVVEVGCGIGEATAPLAAARPDHDLVAFEVWLPGVADTLGRLGEAGVDNVRLCSVDAVWSLRHLFAPASLDEVWTFFPDPWHKTRHHKRRIVSPDFAALVASRLVPGGSWRLATDWAEYADHMEAVLDAEPALAGGVVERWAERPVTRFERKGREAGRDIADLHYVRVDAS